MPVTVNVPIKLRIDRGVVADAELIDEPLQAAVGRALANSLSLVDLRGGYERVRLHDPCFSWSGLSIDYGDRTCVENRIACLLRELASRQGLTSRAASADLPEVLPPDPRAPYDQRRGSPVLGVYSIDSYGGDQEALPVAGRRQLVSSYEDVFLWTVFDDLIDPEVEEQLQSFAEDATPDEPWGVIYVVAKGGATRWRVIITDGLTADNKYRKVGDFWISRFTKPVFRPDNEEVPYAPVEETPSAVDGTVQVVPVPAGAAGVRAKYMELKREELLEDLRRHVRKPPKFKTPKFNELLEKRVDNSVDAMLKDREIDKFIWVKLGTAAYLFLHDKKTSSMLDWKGTARLHAFHQLVRVPKRQMKSGLGGGSGGSAGQASGVAGGKPTGGPGGTGSGKCPPDDVPVESFAEEWQGPLRGEPALEEIGDAGELFKKHISAIDEKLGLIAEARRVGQGYEARFAGQFCINAAWALRWAAFNTRFMVEDGSGENTASQPGQGNLGPVDFAPGASRVIERVRELAGLVPMIERLIAVVVSTFEHDPYPCTIHGKLRGEGVSWARQFLEDVVPVMKDAVGNMFISACRAMLLQLLATSQSEITKRQKAMPRYALLFEKWIVPLIMDAGAVEDLYTRLQLSKVGRNVFVGPQQASWVESSVALVSALASGALVRDPGKAFDVVRDGGVDKIRDEKGVLWSKEDLKNGLKLRRGLMEGVDPLVKQITDLPQAKERFKAAASIRDELDNVLKEMLQNNDEMRVKANGDAMFAFKASAIHENVRRATVPGSSYLLQGVHEMAHEAISDAFRGSSFYPRGIDSVFDSEQGKAALKAAGLMTGFVLLSVLVPGGGLLAFAGGAGLAIHEVGAAYEKKRLFQSLINPDLVLTRAEVEVGIFVSWFGAVLSAIPGAGTATKGLVAAGRALVKREVKAAAGNVGKTVADRVAKELTEYAVRDLLEAFVSGFAIGIVIDQVIQKAMEPLIEQVQKQASLGYSQPGEAKVALSGDQLLMREFIAMVLDAGDPGEE